MFTKLRTKLTVLYGGLFAVALTCAALAVFVSVSGAAHQAVRGDLKAGAAVFDRLWALRGRRLQDSAGLLARDFGFRAAVATGDAATIRSALANLQARAEVDQAFIVGVDGAITSADDTPMAAGAEKLADHLDPDLASTGVLTLGGRPYQAVSSPILSPVLTGWVVFAVKLDGSEMKALEQLSAIPLDAAIMSETDGRWTPAPGVAPPGDPQAVNAFINGSTSRGDAPKVLHASGGDADAIVKPLKSIDGSSHSVLMLRYPLDRAMAPYRPVLATVAITGVLGVLLAAIGSWLLARDVTRPVSALDEAAHRLQRGEAAQVDIESRDEIGRLAASFNAMADAIGDREREITHLAMHDSASGLPNRRTLERTLSEKLARQGSDVTVAFAIRLNRAGHVRGAVGFALFNELLQAVDTRFNITRPGARLALLSSDVLGGAFTAESPADALLIAEQLLDAMEGPVRLGDTTVDAAFRMGIAISPTHGEHVGLLLERAEIAVDQAEAAGRRTSLFDPVLYGDPASNLSLMSEMLSAIDSHSLAVFLQPKFDLRTRDVTGAEALVRWRHPVRGPLSPDLFVSMAEETGHIRAMTDFVLDETLAHQKALAEAGRPLTMSINVSGRLLSDQDFADQALKKVAGAAARIVFEITETAVIDNPEVALAMIEQFTSAGVEVSIDDYGSGLSSLAYLKQIPAQELKIDKAFVMAMDRSQRDALLVKSTIDLAHSLGMKVTAEGVETPAALAILTTMGCDLAQGYLIARPMDLASFQTFMNEEHDERALRLTA